MIKVTLRGILEHKVRFLLSIIAVMLGVSFVGGSLSLGTMLSNTFESIIASSMKGDVYVQTVSGSSMTESLGTSTPSSIPIELADELAAIPGVESASADVSGGIVLVQKDGTAMSSTGAPSFGMAYTGDDRGIWLENGRAPETADEIAVEEATMERSGLVVGDQTKVVIGSEVRMVTVVGEVGLDGPMAGATIVFLDPQSALAAYSPTGTAPTFTVYAEDGVSPESLIAPVEEAVQRIAPDPSDVTVDTGENVREESVKEINELIGFVGSFLLIFAAIALFVGAFIIANTFSMSVAARARELALLRAVGSSRSQVFGSVLGQAAVVGVVGSVLGVFGGLGLVYGIKAVFESFGMALSGNIPMDAGTIALSIAAGVVVSMVAAAVPARRAARTAPVEAMREGASAQVPAGMLRGVLGTLTTVVGIGLVVWAAMTEGGDQLVMVGLGAGLVLVGVLVVAPFVAKAVTGVIALPFVPLAPPMGRLAQRNVARNPKRTASTASALMIGMALVGAATVIASSSSATLASTVDEYVHADLILQGANNTSIPASALDEIEALPQTGRVEQMRGAYIDVNGESGWVTSIDPDAVPSVLELPVDPGSTDALGKGDVLVRAGLAENHGLEVGDTVTLSSPVGTLDAKIGGWITTDLIGGQYYIAPELLDQLAPPEQQMIGLGAVNAADGVSQSDLRAAVVDVVEPYVIVSVQNMEEYRSAVAAQVDQVLTILYALLGLSIIIAVLGIVNTLTLSVMERTREIGLLRAVGLGRLQLSVTIIIESVLISLFGALLGLVIGVGLSIGLIEELGLDTLSIPWAQLAVMIALSALVGVIAAVVPAIRASRLPVLDAIAHE